MVWTALGFGFGLLFLGGVALMNAFNDLKSQVQATVAAQNAAIAALQAAQANAVDPAQVADLTAQLKASTDALAAAFAPPSA
jgi:cell division protein FtsB